ncbi:hypothetical protein K6V78_02315 [Streptococcus gallolyticus]|uniref:competence regulator inhibitor paratox n=1 Tax=Streptococcus hepaticus TaxID=3349163 RepID=UPI001C942921|nr:hypothetical protein [Streptococcus gallolyticus]MBY5040473.1 hypothetical protein [Streptococcus gallolyticus]
MLDLNDFKRAVDAGLVNRDSVRVVVKNGQIVDYLTDDDQVQADEIVKTMSLMDVLARVFML